MLINKLFSLENVQCKLELFSKPSPFPFRFINNLFAILMSPGTSEFQHFFYLENQMLDFERSLVKTHISQQIFNVLIINLFINKVSR